MQTRVYRALLPTVYEYNTSDQIGRFSFYHGHKLGRREAYRWLKELATKVTFETAFGSLTGLGVEAYTSQDISDCGSQYFKIRVLLF